MDSAQNEAVINAGDGGKRYLTKPQRRFLEYGVMFNHEGRYQLQKALERKLCAAWAKDDALAKQQAEQRQRTRLIEREAALALGYGSFVRREALELAIARVGRKEAAQ